MNKHREIKAGYDQMWDVGRTDLMNGEVTIDEVPDASSKRWGISAVFRLPSSFTQSILEVIEDLRKYAGPDHTFYNQANFHVTLRSIEFFRFNTSPDDDAIKKYSDILKQLVPLYPKIVIDFIGLSANRVGIILQGFPNNAQLQLLRQQFHKSLEEHHLLQGPEAQGPRLNAHASLAVFGGNLIDNRGLVEYISQNRNTHFGQVEMQQIDLVAYERSQHDVKIITFDSIALG